MNLIGNISSELFNFAENIERLKAIDITVKDEGFGFATFGQILKIIGLVVKSQSKQFVKQS